MDRDIHRRNVERLERILKAATDESERKFILKLIEEERAKLKNGPKICLAHDSGRREAAGAPRPDVPGHKKGTGTMAGPPRSSPSL
jgi:hypothetical protein